MNEEFVKKGSEKSKYTNKNILHRFFLKRFLDTVYYEISKLDIKSILDFGCGEGYFLRAMNDRGLSVVKVLGVDIRLESLKNATALVPEYDFMQCDLFQLTPEEFRFDLVMAVEVLEHLSEPESYLNRLSLLSSKYVLFTVPFEPWFRIMNLLRGRDILKFGNHPEHINNWSLESFRSFLSPHLQIKSLYVRFPWIISVGIAH